MNMMGKNIIFVAMAAKGFLLKNQTNGRKTRQENYHTCDKNVNLILSHLDIRGTCILKIPKDMEDRNIF